MIGISINARGGGMTGQAQKELRGRLEHFKIQGRLHINPLDHTNHTQ